MKRWIAGLMLLFGPGWLLRNGVRSWWFSFLILLLSLGFTAVGATSQNCYCQCREAGNPGN